MKRKILCIVVSVVLLMGMTAYASEGTEGWNSDSIDRAVPQEKVAELEKLTSGNKMTAYAASGNGGIYEDNDTIETAYPYENTTKIAHKDGEYLGHYNCYYVYTFLETEDDVDWFKVKVRPGYRYVAALKNVFGSQVRDMRLYYQDSDGTWRYIETPEKISRQTIFHFMTKTDTYYIEITGEPAPGYKHDSSANWFAVAPDGTIDERPLAYSPKPSCSLQ